MYLQLFIFLLLSSPVGGDSVSPATLVAAWNNYVAENTYVNGRAHFQLTTNSSATPHRDDTYTYSFRNPGYWVSELHYRGAKRWSEAYGCNPKYDYTLSLDLATEKWRVTETHAPEPAGAERTRMLKSLNWLKGYMFELSNISENLSIDLQEQLFEIKTIATSHDGRWIDVRFVSRDFAPERRRLTTEGSLRCMNKAPYYLPVKTIFTSSWPAPHVKPGGRLPASHDHEFIYDSVEVFPRLKEARRKRTVPGLPEHSEVQDVMKFDLNDEEPPIERFFLSHYGLPEPHGIIAPTPPTPYWLYGTLGSVAVIVLGILLMRWAQRRSVEAR